MTAITPKLAGRSPSSLDSIVLASGAVSPALPAARAMSTLWPRRSNGLYPRIRSGYSPRSGRPSSSERQYLEAAARRSVLQKGSRGHEDDRPRRPAGARGLR